MNPTSGSASESLAAMVESTAAQLRACQVNQADSSEPEKDAAIEAEVRRALERIVPQQQQHFLEELLSRFPGSHDVVAQPAAPAAAPMPADALELTEALLRLCAASGLETRRAVADRLRAAGLGSSRPAEQIDEVNARDLRAKLKLLAEQPLDVNRLSVLLVQLLTLATELDEMTWNVWRMVAPQNSFGRINLLMDSSARYVREGGVVATEAVARDRERLGKLTNLLTWTITRMAARLHRSLLSGLDPKAIWDNAPGKDLPMSPIRSANCWKDYCQRVRGLDAQKVQSEIFRIVEEFVSEQRL